MRAAARLAPPQGMGEPVWSTCCHTTVSPIPASPVIATEAGPSGTEVAEGTIAEVTVCCTGDWDQARQAEHAAAVTLICP